MKIVVILSGLILVLLIAMIFSMIIALRILERHIKVIEMDKKLLKVQVEEYQDNISTLRILLENSKKENNNNETYKRKLETLETEYNSVLLKYKGLLNNSKNDKIK